MTSPHPEDAAIRTLYDPDVRRDVMRRLSSLQPSNARQWGKMTIAQMLAHCATDLEVPCGERVERFCDGGPPAANGIVHAFFGPLTGKQWGRLQYKHLDHHLRQFSA